MKNNVEKGQVTYDQIFKAIGDPHRIRILQLLKEKELSACEILEKIDVVQSTLSHHMKCLVESEAVNAVRHGKWTYYSLNEEKLREAIGFLELFSNGTEEKAFSEEERAQKQTVSGQNRKMPVRQEQRLQELNNDRRNAVPEAPKVQRSENERIEDTEETGDGVKTETGEWQRSDLKGTVSEDRSGGKRNKPSAEKKRREKGDFGKSLKTEDKDASAKADVSEKKKKKKKNKKKNK